MKLKPYGDKIIVKAIIEEKTKGGLYIPQNVEGPMGRIIHGEVVAVSDGYLDAGGTLRNLDSKVGDILVFFEKTGSPYEEDGEKYLILQEGAVLGKLIAEDEKMFIVNEDELKEIDPKEFTPGAVKKYPQDFTFSSRG